MMRKQRVFALIVVALVTVLLSAGPVVADISIELDAEVVPYGTYGKFKRRIDYVKYTGRLISNSYNYNAPFELVVPEDPERGNGRLLVEPYHFVTGAGARENNLTPEFLFRRGFGHAAICWQTPLPGLPEHPCVAFEGENDLDVQLQIIADFANALKQGDLAEQVGEIEKLYSIGFSNSSVPLHPLLFDDRGKDLFDLSFLLTVSSPQDPPCPPESAGQILVFLTEADIIISNGAIFRDCADKPNFRVYELAGMAHINTAVSSVPGFDWTPFLRALFVAGDRWATKGIDPPPNRFIEEAPVGEIDPVYDFPTGIARDENLNAEGGIRTPDLVLGRGQYIAVNFDVPFPAALYGKFIDWKCEPLPDGSPRFRNHRTYVRQFAKETIKLAAHRFLLPRDALRMIWEAIQSDVGKPGTCP